MVSVLFLRQELLPRSWERKERPDPEKKASAVAVKSWIANLGKKNRTSDGDEANSSADPEALKVHCASSWLSPFSRSLSALWRSRRLQVLLLMKCQESHSLDQCKGTTLRTGNALSSLKPKKYN